MSRKKRHASEKKINNFCVIFRCRKEKMDHSIANRRVEDQFLSDSPAHCFTNSINIPARDVERDRRGAVADLGLRFEKEALIVSAPSTHV
jgi:hypothetical protein